MSYAYNNIPIFMLIIPLAFSQSFRINAVPPPLDTKYCMLRMFSNDTSALWACQALDSLQHDWFPSPVAGLYTWLDWNGLNGFWQNGVILQTILDYVTYTKSSRYEKVILGAWRTADDLTHAYYPTPSCDDELWFGLSFVGIYEHTKNESFLKTAADLFNWTWTKCWDTGMTCHGGLYFGDQHIKKITITNAQGLKLGAKLYRITNNTDYLNKTQLILNYLRANKVLDTFTGLVSDSLDITSCLPDMRQNLTYNSGVLLGGLLELYKTTNDSSYLDLSHKIATANIMASSVEGIFTEYCDFDDGCELDADAKAFKGIFLSNLRHLMDFANASMFWMYNEWIQLNIANVIENSLCTNLTQCKVQFTDGTPKINVTGPLFGSSWHGPFNYAAPVHQLSVVSLFTAGIAPATVCKGQACDLDPDVPEFKKLTCASKPCPPSMPCCTWDHHYYTCCEAEQKCINGGCYYNNSVPLWKVRDL